MPKKFLFATAIIATVILVSCSNNKSPLVGNWTAQWVTDPAGYPGVDPSTQFTMDGKFEFTAGGEVTISAYGHDACIFSSDTLVHSLNWKHENDTLRLVNENDIHGMTYTILNLDEKEMKLQLMEDIFLNLKRN